MESRYFNVEIEEPELFLSLHKCSHKWFRFRTLINVHIIPIYLAQTTDPFWQFAFSLFLIVIIIVFLTNFLHASLGEIEDRKIERI